MVSSSCGDGWLVTGSVDMTEIGVDMLDTFSCSLFGALYAFADGATMNFQPVVDLIVQAFEMSFDCWVGEEFTFMMRANLVS